LTHSSFSVDPVWLLSGREILRVQLSNEKSPGKEEIGFGFLIKTKWLDRNKQPSQRW